MKKYFLYTKDTDNDGDLEVHNEDCLLRFKHTLKEVLGYHSSCVSAVAAAKALTKYKNSRINGCKHCCPYCHTG